MLELFRTNIGSHMWKMNHEGSDEDIGIVYMMDSRDLLLGKYPKGKQQHDVNNQDLVYYELSTVIEQLLKGNVNFLWLTMSPVIVSEYRNALKELREVVATNLSKQSYHSIAGIAKHNIYHFIQKGDRDSAIYKKKLNLIGRTLKFGINLLTWGKCMYQKVDIQNEAELLELKTQLDQSYQSSTLPETPDPKPFEQYLIRWRLKYLQQEGFAEKVNWKPK